MKFSIITPCFNAEKYIAETIESVIFQSAILSGKAELEYIICDGNSTDRTVELINSTAGKHQGSSITVVSEKDSGMYDALAKGLRTATGDICAYINAGDYYNEHAFDVVLDVMNSHGTDWLTGMTVICNEHSQVVGATPPPPYRKSLIISGMYGKKLPFIQQESTFWSKNLNRTIDFEALSKFKYAGDYFLWYGFAQIASLMLVEAHLGTFRIHPGQISEDRSGYFREMASFCDRPDIRDFLLAYVDKILWRISRNYPAVFQQNQVFRYNHQAQAWETAK